MPRLMDDRAHAIENAQILIKDKDQPDYIHALCAIMLLEGNAWTSEIQRYLGWDHNRTVRALAKLTEEDFAEVTAARHE